MRARLWKPPAFSAGRRMSHQRAGLTMSHERLEFRRYLAGAVGGSDEAAAGPLELAAEVCTPPAAAAQPEPQYTVNQPPRLQPGNIPLVGTPAYDGFDRVDLVWQTRSAGAGTTDTFEVEFRRVGEGGWMAAPLNPPEDTGFDTRVMHSATLRGLDWNGLYEYRVQHLRAGEVLETFQDTFRTRLAAGDPQTFSFAAYGDSTFGSEGDFPAVQAGITQAKVAFSLLLGDNAYNDGNHFNYDHRLDPTLSPAAVDWIASHVDYFAVGTHDRFDLRPLIDELWGGPIVWGGRTAVELYASPVPEAGVNSPVGLPPGEMPEFAYSFDYGDVHFVAFDSTVVELPTDPDIRRARVEAQTDFLVADLEASEAHWKVVYAHHPFLGTDKRVPPSAGNDDFYLRQMVQRVREAGADIVLTGHSHTYSWTYPITGFEDRDQDGVVELEEVLFVRDEDRSYTKREGLIQLVSGVGGRSIRSTPYDEPFFAEAYSAADTTPPGEFGFARIDVTPRQLTISYISAATGQIVGDFNGNGIADPGEDYFGQFRIVDLSVMDGDVNRDGQLDVADIDALSAALRAGATDTVYDVNRDRQVSADDRKALLDWYFSTGPGDANLDGIFDSADLVMVFQAGEFEDGIAGNSTWSEGDWDGDGEFGTRDLVVAFQAGRYVRV